MSRRSDNVLPRLVESFFRQYLERVRGASRHTVLAYRDALYLLFVFLADTKKCAVADLGPEDVHVDAITGFLTHLEARRGNTPATRNCRLATIRGFVRHLARHDPARAEQYHRILSLPSKKTRSRPAAYLEPEEVRYLLEQPDRAHPGGCRDHALLLFLYNTGARVSEALDVRVRDIDAFGAPHVRLRGKGGKERLCPLWRETLMALKRLPAMGSGAPDQPIFVNARGARLTRDGVAHLLRKYATLAARRPSALRWPRITPHMLRHSCAVALLQAGVDVSVIRDYLGHASVATTSRYLSTNLAMKRAVLETFWQKSGLSPARPGPWRPKPRLLDFLASL
jgi:site-specific recombinase XerD